MLFAIAIILFFVLLNGFFVAAEFAIVKVRASQIEIRIRSGSRLAELAKHMLEHLDAYLSATQLGITLSSLGLGFLGESILKTQLIIIADLYFPHQFTASTISSISFAIAFGLTTVLHIILGELAPKSLAIQRSEQVALAVAVPMRVVYIVFRPFIWMLNGIANLLLRSVGIEPLHGENVHSPEEILMLVNESGKSGMLLSNEQELIENVFNFTELTAKQVMIPRGAISALELSMTSDEIIDKVIEDGYSRMPVYSESIDNIVGIAFAKDLITLMSNKYLIVLHDILHPVHFVREEDNISELLKVLQTKRIHMAVVLDEFGGTAGILSLEDILEEIVGDIQDEYDEEAALLEKISETEFLVVASASVLDINELLPVELPINEDYETIAGLVNNIAGAIPEVGKQLTISEYYTCTIVKGNPRRVEQIRLELLYIPTDTQ
jgi:CBS domain containing-hemolysin-like protein